MYNSVPGTIHLDYLSKVKWIFLLRAYKGCCKKKLNFPFRRVIGLLCGHRPFIKENRHVFPEPL